MHGMGKRKTKCQTRSLNRWIEGAIYKSLVVATLSLVGSVVDQDINRWIEGAIYKSAIITNRWSHQWPIP